MHFYERESELHSLGGLFFLAAADFLRRNDAGDGVLVDELGGLAGLVEEDGECVEALDVSFQLVAAGEIDSDGNALFTN